MYTETMACVKIGKKPVNLLYLTFLPGEIKGKEVRRRKDEGQGLKIGLSVENGEAPAEAAIGDVPIKISHIRIVNRE